MTPGETPALSADAVAAKARRGTVVRGVVSAIDRYHVALTPKWQLLGHPDVRLAHRALIAERQAVHLAPMRHPLGRGSAGDLLIRWR